MKERTYFGFLITRQTEPGRLPWRAWHEDTGFLVADTLAGIKELIREWRNGRR
jgi:hypothetical protein